jgi:hypothetical protein
VCVAGEKCKEGTSGAADGQFDELGETRNAIAVGPTGLVYVADRARVQVFEPSGVWKETISLAGLSSTGMVSGLAVDSSGDVFVRDNEVAGVHEFEPGGVERGVVFDSGSTSIASIALDRSGDLYVGDTNGGLYNGFHVLKYTIATGKEVGNFGANTVRGGTLQTDGETSAFFYNGMAFSEASGTAAMYVTEQFVEASQDVVTQPASVYASVWVLPVPPPGPAIEAESATPGPRGSVSVEATIDPEGNETSYHIEYVSDADFTKGVGGKACEWACASVAAGGTLPASVEQRPVGVRVTGLTLSSSYHYRVVASNSEGTATGPGQTFETLPAAYLESEYSTDVASSSATLDAQVNPLESSTEYRIEYGTSAAYEHVLGGKAGEGAASVVIGGHVQELSPGTNYHYRIVLRNELGTVEGADRTFTTQPAGGESPLPDGRQWQLVSPPDKKGALIELFSANTDAVQAARDGSAIAYGEAGPAAGENVQGHTELFSPILSVRGPSGWRSEDLELPIRLPENGEVGPNLSEGGNEIQLFSEDLSSAIAVPQQVGTPPLSPKASERTVYLRDNASGRFTPLVTAENVPAGTKFGGGESGSSLKDEEMYFVAATPDLDHVVLKSPYALTPEANESFYLHNEQWNLYEWSGGSLRLVNILPDGQATHGEEPDVRMANGSSGEGNPYGANPSTISRDGRRIAWELSSSGVPQNGEGLYVRDMVEERTVQVGGPHALFQWMSSEGSLIFYLEGGDLHVYDFETGAQTDLTADHGAHESSAGVQQLVSDVSSDGSYVYFVASGVLGDAAGAVSGEDNLYLLHEHGGAWSTAYIATLSPQDEKDWFERGTTLGVANLARISSRVSPDGRYLAFMSERSLTGYDNTDAISGRADEEVYLYDADTARLVCASCNPTGARPVGAYDSQLAPLSIDRRESWTGRDGGVADPWLAGSVPGWDEMLTPGSLYQPRYLSDSGRLFFDSPDGLVPQATNGLEDVYEYEPEGVGDCTSASVTFSGRSGGCVGLISAGTSSAESVFLDASETGDDVFFITASKLSAADYDNGFDVYDAHVCSGEVPCVASPVSPPPCSSGDSCKAAPSPQPEIFGPAPSATFSGIGNVREEAKAKVKPKKKGKPKRKGKAKLEAKKKPRRRHGERKARVTGTDGKNGRRSL